MCSVSDERVVHTEARSHQKTGRIMWHDQSPFLSHAFSACMATLLFGSLVGCDTVGFLSGTPDPAAQYELPNSVQTTIGPNIEVTLQTPDTVTTGDAFVVRVRLDNPSSETVTVTTGNVSLWDFGIYDGEEVVPVKGSMLGYATVVTDHQIDPGVTTGTIDLQAVQSSNEETPISPGTYTARLALNWRIDETNVSDTLATTMVFRTA